MLQIAIITYSFTNFNYITDYNLQRSDVTSYIVTKPKPKHCTIPYTPQLGFKMNYSNTDGEFPYGTFAHFTETDLSGEMILAGEYLALSMKTMT